MLSRQTYVQPNCKLAVRIYFQFSCQSQTSKMLSISYEAKLTIVFVAVFCIGAYSEPCNKSKKEYNNGCNATSTFKGDTKNLRMDLQSWVSAQTANSTKQEVADTIKLKLSEKYSWASFRIFVYSAKDVKAQVAVKDHINATVLYSGSLKHICGDFAIYLLWSSNVQSDLCYQTKHLKSAKLPSGKEPKLLVKEMMEEVSRKLFPYSNGFFLKYGKYDKTCGTAETTIKDIKKDEVPAIICHNFIKNCQVKNQFFGKFCVAL